MPVSLGLCSCNWPIVPTKKKKKFYSMKHSDDRLCSVVVVNESLVGSVPESTGLSYFTALLVFWQFKN